MPYLCLLREDAAQRAYNLRDIFDGVRWIVCTGSPSRYLLKDFPWETVYQQSRRWLAAGCFEAIIHDLRAILRFAAGKEPGPTAVIFDGCTIQSTLESVGRAGYDGYERKKGSKVHMAVDTMGHLLALHITPADEQERDQVAILSERAQGVTGESVELAYVDQGYTGDDRDVDAAGYDTRLVVGVPEAKEGFVLLPRRLVGERSSAWMERFRRLAREYERLDETLEGLHDVAFSILMLQDAAPVFQWSS